MTRSHPKHAPVTTNVRIKKQLCPVAVSYGRNSGNDCGLVVAKKCQNGACSKHCSYKGGCDIHPPHSRHNAADASDVARWIESSIVALEPNSVSSEVRLPMPLPTPSELAAREQRELREAIDQSLCPTVPDNLPPFSSNSYNSAIVTASSIASGSGPPLSFIPYIPSRPPMSMGPSIEQPRTIPSKPLNSRPSILSITSADRAKQRATDLPDNVTVERLPPALSQQMSKEWTEQTVKRKESQAQALHDTTLQQSLARQGQHEFRLGYFPATNTPIQAQLVQDVAGKHFPWFPLADRLPDLIGCTYHEVELLHEASRTWLSIGKGHTIKLVVNQSVLLRKKGVKCLGIDQHLSQAIKPLRPPNIRTHMPSERSYILDAMKGSKQPLIARDLSPSPPASVLSPPMPHPKVTSSRKGKMRALSLDPLSDDSDIDFDIFKDDNSESKPESDPDSSDVECSEVRKPDKNYVPPARPRSPSIEIIDDSGAPLATNPHIKPENMRSLKRKLKVEEDSSAYSLTKRSRFIEKGASFNDPIHLASQSSLSLSPTFTPFSSPSSSRASQIDTSTSSEQGTDRQPQWPGSLYTSDLLRGFRRMDLVKIGSTEDRFNKVFPGAKFVRQTYYDARTRLGMMAQQDIDHSVAAVDTPKGLWSRLARLYPLKPSKSV